MHINTAGQKEFGAVTKAFLEREGSPRWAGPDGLVPAVSVLELLWEDQSSQRRKRLSLNGNLQTIFSNH